MDPDGVYYGDEEVRRAEKSNHRPEPSAPPIDQECLLSATSLDPPEEDVAALALGDEGTSGRAHNLEPLGLADDGVINPVAATYAIPSITDTNLDQLPVASAVPIITDAVGASTHTTNWAAPSSGQKNSSALSSIRNTNKEKVSANKPNEGSLAELRLRRQEREQSSAPNRGAPSPLTLIENPRLDSH